MTYQCQTCKAIFDEPLYIHDQEYADYGIGGQWITIYEGDVCPDCESEEFEVHDFEAESSINS
jgi:hypothetical protein